MTRLFRSAAIFALAGFMLAGCSTPQPGPNYYINSPDTLAGIKRVVLIELAQNPFDPPVARQMTDSLFQSIQARRLFHINLLPSNEPVYEQLPVYKTEPFTLEELNMFAQYLDCDAILIGRITRYQTYPKMLVGLYLRMIDVRQGRLVWAIEDVWDTRDKAMEERIKVAFDSNIRTGYEPLQWLLVMRSPMAFQKFVADDVASTVPLPGGQQQPTFADILAKKMKLFYINNLK
ncbi:MAG: hypothetical protein HZA50_11470 [Planctomycetes bacterium]|nr:hypothetical protein [Planctomycetota bacterium]